MTIDEFYQEVKQKMAEHGIPEDTPINYINTYFKYNKYQPGRTINYPVSFKIKVSIGDNGMACIE